MLLCIERPSVMIDAHKELDINRPIILGPLDRTARDVPKAGKSHQTSASVFTQVALLFNFFFLLFDE